jgi:hypothetical protein
VIGGIPTPPRIIFSHRDTTGAGHVDLPGNWTKDGALLHKPTAELIYIPSTEGEIYKYISFAALPRPLDLPRQADNLAVPTILPRNEGLGLPCPVSKIELPDELKDALHDLDLEVPKKRQDLPGDSLELPLLIPSIPSAIEPLTTIALPLPILQVPTPPLERLDYNGSDIHPKRIGSFWTGSGDNMRKDFLPSYSLDDVTFGTLLRVVDVPSSGNSPHHLGKLLPTIQSLG